MIIAWDNKLKSATLAASNENANYPVENVIDKWKKLYFSAGATTTTITITFSADRIIRCIGLAYHNLTSCSAVLKDSGGSTIDTWTIPVTNQTELYAETTSHSNVRSIEISCVASADIYIGAIFAGNYKSLNKETGQNLPVRSTANITKSIGGQVAGRTGVMLRSADIRIPSCTNTDRESIENIYEQLQEVYPFWLDLWQSSHSSFAPVYGHFTSPLEIQKDEYENFDISFGFEEAN